MSCRSSGRALSIAFVVALLGAACVAPTSGADLVLRDVRVVDVRSGEVRAEQAIVVRGERIVAVGPTLDVEVPSGARVIDGGDASSSPACGTCTHLRVARAAPSCTDPLYVRTACRRAQTWHAPRLSSAPRERADLRSPRVAHLAAPVDGVLPFRLASPPRTRLRRALVAPCSMRRASTRSRSTIGLAQAYFALADEAERRGLAARGARPAGGHAAPGGARWQDDIEHLTPCSRPPSPTRWPGRRPTRGD
ncbi:MAG: hypothetical protein H6825_10865 [Planctomycetes bacterium]|nr:hypothetical protein [Planctomycetota bacterium]